MKQAVMRHLKNNNMQTPPNVDNTIVPGVFTVYAARYDQFVGNIVTVKIKFQIPSAEINKMKQGQTY